jgi:propionate CoA-transferase
VDHIVVDRFHEQAASIPMRRYWPMFTVGFQEDPAPYAEKLRWLNDFLKITPVRNELGRSLARLGASLFARMVGKGAMVNIGSGYPEEIARVLVEQGLGKDLLFTTEAGVYGGLPAPGIFFSAAIAPIRLERSSTMFRRYQDGLDVTVLGMLQADEKGNVNVSRRGKEVTKYGGPGGLPDIVEYAKTLIFVGKWMDGADIRIKDGRVRILKTGKPKLVRDVDEITFSGHHAVTMGKQVYYITNVGIFHLTRRGMELIEIMPGIDVKKDILDQSPARIIIPEGGPVVADRSILDGHAYSIALRKD